MLKKNAQNLRWRDQWQERLADELHKPIKRNFQNRRLIVHNVDDIWCSDLVDMQKLSKWNKDYKYLLMVLDLFSKYGWIVPFKTKIGLEVSKSFGTIFEKAKAKPKKLWVDKGKEYYKNRSAMRTWGLMLKFIPFGWNAILTYQCLEVELLQAKR